MKGWVTDPLNMFEAWFENESDSWQDYSIFYSLLGGDKKDMYAYATIAVYDGTSGRFTKAYRPTNYDPDYKLHVPPGLTREETKAWLVAFRTTII